MTATTKTGKITLILFALLLAFCVVLAAVALAPANNTAAAEEAVTAAEGEGGETPATDSHANHDGWTALSSDGGTLLGGNYYLPADVQLYDSIYIAGPVTLCLNGYVLRGNGTQFVIQVSDGSSLTLCDCQSESEAEEHRHDYYVAESGLYVFDDGTDEWTATYNAAKNTGTVAGGVITGGNAYNFGGGVYVGSGTFTMSGGTISGNTAGGNGGGVYVYSGTFAMENGTMITDNTAAYYGGGVYVGGGTFTMSGGTISGNTASGDGGGVYVYSGTFAMENGTMITDNTSYHGGGVYVDLKGTFTMGGGTISGNAGDSGSGSGGGVCNLGAFAMSGGTINGNAVCSGGGVCSAGTFTMTGGTISGNSAAFGGGVYVGKNTFEMSGGTISGNTANYGGGVYVAGGAFAMTEVIFTMSGGYFGGTVYVETDAEVSVSGGYFENENLKDYVAEGHTLCDISSLGAESDEDYVEGFPYAVYGQGSVSVTVNSPIMFDGADIQEGIDFTVEVEEGIELSYSYSNGGAYTDGLPSDIGSYTITALAIDGANKTAYEAQFELTISDASPNIEIFEALRDNGVISVAFESDLSGQYAYAVVKDGQTAPADWSGYDRYDMSEGVNAFTVPDANKEGKEIYIMAWGPTGVAAQRADSIIEDRVYTVYEGFAALTETTPLPYNATVELGGESTVLYDVDGNETFGVLVKMQLSAGQVLSLEFYGDNDAVNTRIIVYKQLQDDFVPVFACNSDNKNEYGERAFHSVSEDGTYYVAFLGFDDYERGVCNIAVAEVEGVSEIDESLDFTAEQAPVPQPDDLWSWDADSKTLSLKDGLYLYNDSNSLQSMIILPDGATVVVEGNAAFYNQGGNIFYCHGALTIRGVDVRSSVLTVDLCVDNAIECEGDLIVENCGIDIVSCYDVICSRASVTIRNVEINAANGTEVINALGDVFVIDSDIFADNFGCVIYLPSSGECTVRDSNITATHIFYAIYFEGIGLLTVQDSNLILDDVACGIYNAGDLVVDGGKIDFDCVYDCIRNDGKLTLKNGVALDVDVMSGNGATLYAAEFEVVDIGDCRMYGADGTLLYEGPFDASFFDAEKGSFFVNGVRVAGIAIADRYTVTVSGGTIEGSTDATVVVDENSSVTVIAGEAPEGKVFKGWSADGGATIISTDEVYAFTASGNVTLTAVYSDVVTEPDESGTPDDDIVDVPENTGGLTGGAIAGIVIGSILGALLIAYGVCALLYKKKLVKGAFFEKIYPFIK